MVSCSKLSAYGRIRPCGCWFELTELSRYRKSSPLLLLQPALAKLQMMGRLFHSNKVSTQGRRNCAGLIPRLCRQLVWSENRETLAGVPLGHL
jgi:hypothetical protein